MKSQLPIASSLNRPLAKPIIRKAEKHYPHNHLQSLFDGFVDFSGVENCDLSFKGLSINSNKIHEEYLFLACAGVGDSLQHGIAYAGEAINLGANCVAWEPTAELESMPVNCPVEKGEGTMNVPLIQVEGLHDKVGEIAARFHQHPSHSMNVIGITGTNGKTSIAHFIAQLTHSLNNVAVNKISQKTPKKCAVIGTLGNGLYGQLKQGTHITLTTPDAVTVQELIAEFRDEQAETLVMEVSSHALSQGRVKGVEFDCAIFTNLTRDHLDYHGDMKSYANEKLKLFHFSSLKQIIVNQDDLFSEEIIESIKHHSYDEKISVIRYSRKDESTEYFADSIHLGHKGISFRLHVKGETAFKVKTSIVGDFNIENILASIAVLHTQGNEISTIVDSIEKLIVVPGRMEKVTFPSPVNHSSKSALPLIVVDYAHTSDALDKALRAVRAHARGQLICLFGCGGDRDKGKRPLMAKVAEQLADQVVITSDNPRTESAKQIIEDIMTGFKQPDDVMIEIDREKAIHSTLNLMNANDVLLIAGKGHENYQEINGQRFPFSDKGCVHSFAKAEWEGCQ